MFVGLRWGLLLAENSSHHYHVAAPALRSRTHVSAFALIVYWHDPNRILIVAARFLGSTTWKKKFDIGFTIS